MNRLLMVSAVGNILQAMAWCAHAVKDVHVYNKGSLGSILGYCY